MRKTLTFIFVLSLSWEAATQEQWEQVVDGFYEGQRVNLFHQSVARGKAAATDIDGDNDLDLFIGGDYLVRFFRNDGTPEIPAWTLVDDNIFNMPKVFQSYEFLEPTAADLDNDGDPDFVVSTVGGQIYYYRNNGDGTFTQVTTQLVSNGGPASVDLEDMDQDGDFDLMVSTGGAVLFFENVGSKEVYSFAAPVNTGVTGASGNDGSISLADIDGDGYPDLFTAIRDPHFHYYRNTSTPASLFPSFTFVTADYFDLTGSIISVIPSFFDKDNDGDTDCLLFSQHQSRGFYAFMENVGTVFSASWTQSFKGFNTFTYKFLNGIGAFGDLDSDGDLDLIQSGRTIAFGLYENRGSPTNGNWVLSDDSLVPRDTDTDNYYSPELSDIDNDGDLDLFAKHHTGPPGGSQQNLLFWANVGTAGVPSFASVTTSWESLPTGASTDGFCFGDLNGDGLTDVLLGRVNNVEVYYNIGSESNPDYIESTPDIVVNGIQPSGSGTNHSDPKLVDIDIDGDLDLFIAIDGVGGSVEARGARINLFRNIGSSTEPQFLLEDAEWNQLELEYELFLTEGDIDGDGFPNLFTSDFDGGMLQFRAHLPALETEALERALLPGEQTDLQVAGNVGSVTLTIEENRSGGSVSGLTYTAGSTTGVVDQLKLEDSGSTKVGYAYAYVISASEVSSTGKAIILAGKKEDPDPVWPATDYLAQFAYRTCLAKGFGRDQIAYLSPVTGVDVDGDGDSGNDIDALSTLANLQVAIDSASDTHELTIFCVDHGFDEDASGRFRVNETGEVLTAEQLDAWLDTIQVSSSMKVNLIIDSCKSGAFLPVLLPPPGKQRIVVTASSAGELTYFLGQGLISFSDAFWNGILARLSIKEAFDHAVDAINRFQTPQLDDTGDGVYDQVADGSAANQTHIGLSTVAGADHPQISGIVGNQVISGTNSASIWARVSSVNPLDRVWMSIVSPSFEPDPDSNDPVIDLPTQELVWNSPNNRYEGTYDSFNESGAYKIIVYAEDIWGFVSIPKQIYVHRTDFTEKAIVLVGEDDYGPGQPFANSNAVGTLAYRTLLSRWFGPDDIDYFNPQSPQDLDGDATDDVDGSPTLAALQNAITVDASGAEKLTVSLIGQGSPDSLKLNGTENLTPTDLDTWLDTFQSVTGTPVIVILEFQDSGTWPDDLEPPEGMVRIVIASAAPGYQSYCFQGGIFSFSQYFWNGVFLGENLRDTFRVAQPVLRQLTLNTQIAGMTDDGDGIVNQKSDGLLARTFHIGPGFLTGGDDLPTIGEVAGTVYLTTSEDTAAFWCANVFDSDGIRSVTATIVPPNFPSSLPVPRAVTFNGSNSRYEAFYNNFTETGSYTLVYTAEDNEGNISSDVFGEVFQYGNGDAFEIDDASPEASILVVDWFPQQHNHHDNGDTDWV